MKSIIYIDRNNLYFYGGNVHAPLTMPFQPITIRDIEIINSEELEKQINDFIKNNKIEPTDSGIVVAHQSSFVKSIPPKTPPDQITLQRKQFIENVPFEETLSKEFVTAKGTIIIATNKDLVYFIRDIFNKNHFKVELIAPVAAIFPEGDVTFNTAAAQQIVNKASVLKQQSFELQDIEVPITDSFEEGFIRRKKNATLYYMIPIFVVLIGILVWLILGQRSESNNKENNVPSPTIVSARVSTIPTITPIPGVASNSASLLPKETITFQVLNGSGVPGQADTIRDQLIDDGYTNVSTGNAPTLQSNRTLIVYKSRILGPQIQEIANIITNAIGEVTTQVNDEIEYDVLITTSAPNSQTQSVTPTPIP